MDLDARLSARARRLRPSPIRELQRYVGLEGMISLGGGYPNPETFAFASLDLELVGGGTVTVTGTDLAAACQYGPSSAHRGLGPELITWHRSKDAVELDDSRLVVLNGSQEGLFALAYLFLDPGDGVCLSEPAYPGALTTFAAFTSNFVPVPVDGDGLDTDALEATLDGLRGAGRALPKILYTVPNGHNPAGVTQTLERRTRILDLASAFDLIVIEDDPYQLIRLEPSPLLPTLQALDRDGRVIRLDSFSKVLAPGLRLGYASGGPDILRLLVLFKQVANLHTSTLTQELLRQTLASYGPVGLRRQIAASCRLYRRNRDLLVEAAHRHLPPEVRFHTPSDGMFLWLELPEPCDAEALVERHARELGVVLVPGPAFSTRGGCRHCMRACFSLVDADRADQGMARFAEMIRRGGGAEGPAATP